MKDSVGGSTRSGPSGAAKDSRLLSRQQGSKEQLRLIAIVPAAAQLNILRRRGSSGREGDDVVELQEAAFGASTIRPDEGTLASVARPDVTDPLPRPTNIHRYPFASRAAVRKTESSMDGVSLRVFVF